jgi:hypothetical protein
MRWFRRIMNKNETVWESFMKKVVAFVESAPKKKHSASVVQFLNELQLWVVWIVKCDLSVYGLGLQG